MSYIYLILTVLLCSLQNVATKQYTNKQKTPNMLLFVAMTVFCAMVFFLFSAKFRLHFNLQILPYSLAFAVSYGTSFVGSCFAIKTGPLSISSLITSYSMLIPTLYGIWFLNEQPTVFSYVGIALLLISLLLINIKKEEMTFSPAWIFFLFMAFVGNGMCSTVQKMQQLRFEGAYKSEFMIVSLLAVCICLFLAGIIHSKGGVLRTIRQTLPYAPIQGFANGAVNLLVMVLTASIPTAVLFPTISAGGIILTFVLSVFLYKEKLSRWQYVGFAAGTASVILLNM